MNCKVMGIVNVTPDSFSDGGRFFRPDEAVRRARNLIEEGADIIDLGGESTRPGATPLGWEEEWTRLKPVIETLDAGTVPVSVDTYHPETAERAVASGARIINCVEAGSVPAMLSLLSKNKGIELVVPCRLGDWPPMSGKCSSSLALQRSGDSSCNWCGVASLEALTPDIRSRLYLDPMIGFGTTREDDLQLLGSVPELAARGRILVGASRKRIVKKLTGEKVTGKNLGGNLAIAVWCAAHGASVIRVHDVRETVQALRVWSTLDGVCPQVEGACSQIG